MSPQCIKSAYHDIEGDRALLRYKETAFLTRPLQPGDTNTAADHGQISHDHIIGKQVRDLVTTSKGVKLRVHLPTLEEYVTLTPRIVTPVSEVLKIRRRIS